MSLVASALALLAGGPVARAAVLTTVETEPFTLSTDTVTFTVANDFGVVTNTNNGPQTAGKALTFDQFDPLLGTLTAVKITFGTTYGAAATVDVTISEEAGTTDFFADATVNHSLAAAGLITPATALQQFSATCTESTSSCPGSTSDNGVGFSSLPTGVSILAALTSFVGTGTYDLTATLSSALAPRISPDNGTGFAANTTFTGSLTNANWNGTVTVEYTYTTNETAVPSPLSLYLLASGLAGGALWRRYRR